MKEIIFSIKRNPDNEYEARAIGHSIFTIADTKEELAENIKDAVKCHFDEEDLPSLINLHYTHDEVILL